jgi:hypothetical protein
MKATDQRTPAVLSPETWSHWLDVWAPELRTRRQVTTRIPGSIPETMALGGGLAVPGLTRFWTHTRSLPAGIWPEGSLREPALLRHFPAGPVNPPAMFEDGRLPAVRSHIGLNSAASLTEAAVHSFQCHLRVKPRAHEKIHQETGGRLLNGARDLGGGSGLRRLESRDPLNSHPGMAEAHDGFA